MRHQHRPAANCEQETYRQTGPDQCRGHLDRESEAEQSASGRGDQRLPPQAACRPVGRQTGHRDGHRRHSEHDRLAVQVRASHQHQQHQRIGDPQQGRPQLPARITAAEPVQHQPG